MEKSPPKPIISILKKDRNSECLNLFANLTIAKKVSFSEEKYVREFKKGRTPITIWGKSYTESINTPENSNRTDIKNRYKAKLASAKLEAAKAKRKSAKHSLQFNSVVDENKTDSISNSMSEIKDVTLKKGEKLYKEVKEKSNKTSRDNDLNSHLYQSGKNISDLSNNLEYCGLKQTETILEEKSNEFKMIGKDYKRNTVTSVPQAPGTKYDRYSPTSIEKEPLKELKKIETESQAFKSNSINAGVIRNMWVPRSSKETYDDDENNDVVSILKTIKESESIKPEVTEKELKNSFLGCLKHLVQKKKRNIFGKFAKKDAINNLKENTAHNKTEEDSYDIITSNPKALDNLTKHNKSNRDFNGKKVIAGDLTVPPISPFSNPNDTLTPRRSNSPIMENIEYEDLDSGGNKENFSNSIKTENCDHNQTKNELLTIFDKILNETIAMNETAISNVSEKPNDDDDDDIKTKNTTRNIDCTALVPVSGSKSTLVQFSQQTHKIEMKNSLFSSGKLVKSINKREQLASLHFNDDIISKRIRVTLRELWEAFLKEDDTIRQIIQYKNLFGNIDMSYKYLNINIGNNAIVNSAINISKENLYEKENFDTKIVPFEKSMEKIINDDMYLNPMGRITDGQQNCKRQKINDLSKSEQMWIINEPKAVTNPLEKRSFNNLNLMREEKLFQLPIANSSPTVSRWEIELKKNIIDPNWKLEFLNFERKRFIIFKHAACSNLEFIVECLTFAIKNYNREIHRVYTRKCSEFNEESLLLQDRLMYKELINDMPANVALTNNNSKLEQLKNCFNEIILKIFLKIQDLMEVLIFNNAYLKSYEDTVLIAKTHEYYSADNILMKKSILMVINEIDETSIENVIEPPITEFDEDAIKEYPKGIKFINLILLGPEWRLKQ